MSTPCSWHEKESSTKSKLNLIQYIMGKNEHVLLVPSFLGKISNCRLAESMTDM